ncbi:MAG: D-tagatose-1,6-bisphosphate aldolase subunit GatY [Oscillospiraceae bacterium]|jgi:fructose-bisphosphate aldolase, class II
MKWDNNYVKEAAYSKKIVPGFNIFGHEDAGAVIRAAERANVPVILMVNRDARAALAIEHWGALLNSMAKQAKVPVGVHMDHCSDPAHVKRAIASGFTSVMFDGSKMPFEENVRITAEIAREAHQKNIFVEGELGNVPYSDMGKIDIQLTSPEEARKMQEQTELDWLAVSVGNVHRLANRKVPIRFEVLKEIQEQCSLPLVIHGASGIYDEDMQKLKLEHIGKMNLGTSLRKIFGDTMRRDMEANPDEFDRQKLMKHAIENVEEAAYQIIQSLQ